MADYQKINTVFFRDINNVIMVNERFVMNEFEYLRNCKFEATEKIDGTNIHVDLTYDENGEPMISYHGRTETAEIPPHLLSYLQEKITKDMFLEVFADAIENKKTIQVFGEGYGNKIQKDGKQYIKDGVSFILFDVRIGDLWLLRDSLVDIAHKLDLQVVPIIGMMTIDDAIDFVKKGFNSTIAENKSFGAEGLVLKTPYGLCDRMGNRIVLKIKTKDFRRYVAKYGSGFDAPQIMKPIENKEN